MKVETTSLKPNFGTFFGSLLLATAILAVLGIAIRVFVSSSLFEPYFYRWWTYSIFAAIGTSVGVTLGARRSQLVITDTDDAEKTEDWILEFFLENGLSIRENDDNGTTLASRNKLNRLFNNWLETELVSVRQVADSLIVEGPLQHVNAVDLKLRFGKPLIENRVRSQQNISAKAG